MAEKLGVHRAERFAADWADPGGSARCEKVFVAALGHAYGPNAERGVFVRMTEGEAAKILFHDENTGAIDWRSSRDTKHYGRAMADAAAAVETFIRLKWAGSGPIVRRMPATIGTGDGHGLLRKDSDESELRLRRAIRGGFI